MQTDCVFYSAGGRGALSCKKTAPRPPRKELLNMLLKLVCGQANQSLKQGYGAIIWEFSERGSRGKTLLQKGFPPGGPLFESRFSSHKLS